jgi:hypothetical protein
MRRLEALLPKSGTAPEHCLDGARLLAILGEAYGHGSPNAQRRTLQRDLEALVKEARIEAVNPGGKPLRYRRCGDGEVVAPEAFRLFGGAGAEDGHHVRRRLRSAVPVAGAWYEGYAFERFADAPLTLWLPTGRSRGREGA